MSTRHEPDSVKPALRRAEAEVARHLEEACEDIEEKDLSQESLDELLRLEDELLAAARAVDEAVRLRQQLGERSTRDAGPRESNVASAPPPPLPDEPSGSRLREFRDTSGKEWRVWEVKPGSSGRQANPQRYLGEYVKGWLAFECLLDEARKRLPAPPAEWFRMGDADLGGLLPRAVDVPKRKPKQPETTPTP
jgi:hypothetical protein